MGENNFGGLAGAGLYLFIVAISDNLKGVTKCIEIIVALVKLCVYKKNFDPHPVWYIIE